MHYTFCGLLLFMMTLVLHLLNCSCLLLLLLFLCCWSWELHTDSVFSSSCVSCHADLPYCKCIVLQSKATVWRLCFHLTSCHGASLAVSSSQTPSHLTACPLFVLLRCFVHTYPRWISVISKLKTDNGELLTHSPESWSPNFLFHMWIQTWNIPSKSSVTTLRLV